MLLVDSALVSAHSSAMHTPIGSPVFAALSSARGGGLPLLHELHVDSSFSPTGVSWRLLKVIGKDLPELEVLGLHCVRRNYSNLVAELTGLGADDFAIMPRLRSLVIKRERSYFGGHVLTSEGISKLFVALFRTAPNLASFEFDHGSQTSSTPCCPFCAPSTSTSAACPRRQPSHFRHRWRCRTAASTAQVSGLQHIPTDAFYVVHPKRRQSLAWLASQLRIKRLCHQSLARFGDARFQQSVSVYSASVRT